jgi:hypothetical protein
MVDGLFIGTYLKVEAKAFLRLLYNETTSGSFPLKIVPLKLSPFLPIKELGAGCAREVSRPANEWTHG